MNKGIDYARHCARMKEGGAVPVYVIKQAKAWIRIYDGKSKTDFFDEREAERITNVLRLMVHPDLLCPMDEGLEPYALWLIFAVFCTKRRANNRRTYHTAILEIARKNFKTFTSAVIFIISMLLEPRFARLFSVAPNFKLSDELRKAVEKIVKSSPLLVNHFKVCRDYVKCLITDIEYTPLAYSNNRLDGRQANVWLADEAGTMDSYPITAMRISQTQLKNKLGIIISTQYPNEHNGFNDEVDYAKKVFDGVQKADDVFALLYEPDPSIAEKWETDDRVLMQANPTTQTNPELLETLQGDRTMAILYENKREEFLCKQCNIAYKGIGAEGYIPIDIVRKCKTDGIDWSGRTVYLGVDLSQTDDNTAVAMVSYDAENDMILARVTGFIPKDRIDTKTLAEKFDYKKAIRHGDCFACGDTIIDYGFVEQYILSIEKDFDVAIQGAGFDRYNAMSTMQRLESADDPVECTEVRQHSSVLHPATKLLYEYVCKGHFRYEYNMLLENSFSNARCTEDTNLNKYVNKKRSKGKVDMVVALINAVYMLMQFELLDGDDFFVG